MSLVFSRSERHLKALHGIDEQPKERRKSRLRVQRDELLAALKECFVALRHHTMSHAGREDTEARAAWEQALALIERIEKGEAAT